MENQNANVAEIVLTPNDMDTLGEVMNISMGSAATAISNMLDKQVIITTPHLELQQYENLDYSDMEPAVLVKISYTEGMEGTNLMMFRSHDMQVILNLLMGNEDVEPDDNYVFDDMSMSAACEVMNQMMGAAATALADILETPVNITTPEACLLDQEHPFDKAFFDIPQNSEVVSISFDLDIKGIMNTNFMSVMPTGLAKGLVDRLMSGQEAVAAQVPPPPPPEPVAAPAPAAPPVPAAPPAPAAPPVPAMAPEPVPAAPAAPAPVPAAPPPAAAPVPPAADPSQQAAYMQQPSYPQQPYYQQPYYPQQPAYPPTPPTPQMYGAPGYVSPGVGTAMPEGVTIKKAQFPDFSEQESLSRAMSRSNMGLLMNVALEVSVEIGKTKRKIKDIADFAQGTVLELEKQAGAPVDIIVNGQLLAHGDVVVIGDNFGVRITEIVGTKELLDSLENAL